MDLTPFPADVGVAIIAHNARGKIAPALASLERAGCPRASLLIVDVASTDGLLTWLDAAYPGIKTIRLDANEGPNPGRNRAIRETPQRFVFLMDPDVQVQGETIQRLRDAMAADSTIKIGSPIVVHAEEPDRIQYAGTSLHFICEAINPWIDRTLAERGAARLDLGVAAASGLLLDRQASIDVGLFDERYFMGKDDGDFTYRMRVAGHRIVELADAILLHQTGPRSDWLFYYQIRNRWHFMLKNYELGTLVCIAPCLLVHETLQLVLLHLKGHGRTYWKAVGGLMAMLPTLGRDRAFVSSIRRLPDAKLLRGDSLLVRGDLAGGGAARAAKAAYETFLRGYWRLLTSTVLGA